MDDWFDNLPKLVAPAKRPIGEAEDDGNNPWLALFQQHPESGGPFGGRDNALTALVGFFRAKGFPIEAAREFALDWNNRHCLPPLDVESVYDKIARAWIEWNGGTLPDNTPTEPTEPTELEIMRWPDMQRKVVELGNVEWIVPDVLLAGGLAFISAPAGGGKSWVAADLVRCLSMGELWLGQLDVALATVLYIDEEMGLLSMFHRLDGLGANPLGLHYMNQQGVRLDNPAHMKQLINHIKEFNIRLVIIDTFVRVHGHDENDNSKMSALYRSFKQIKQAGCAILALHHNRKSGTEAGVAHEQMRGAGDIAAQADTVFSISKKDNVYTMKATKNRHCDESRYLNISWQIVTVDGRIAIMPVEPQTVDIDINSKILDCCPIMHSYDGLDDQLAMMPTGNDIHRRIGGNKATLIRCIKDLVTSGDLVAIDGKRRAVHYCRMGERQNVLL